MLSPDAAAIAKELPEAGERFVLALGTAIAALEVLSKQPLSQVKGSSDEGLVELLATLEARRQFAGNTLAQVRSALGA